MFILPEPIRDNLCQLSIGQGSLNLLGFNQYGIAVKRIAIRFSLKSHIRKPASMFGFRTVNALLCTVLSYPTLSLRDWRHAGVRRIGLRLPLRLTKLPTPASTN